MLIWRNVDGSAEMSGSPIKMFLSPQQEYSAFLWVLLLRCPVVSNTALSTIALMYSSNTVLMCHCCSVFQRQGITSLDYNNTGKWTSALRKQSRSVCAVVLCTGTVGYNQHFSHCAWMQDMISKGFWVLQSLLHVLAFALHGLDPRFSGTLFHCFWMTLDHAGSILTFEGAPLSQCRNVSIYSTRAQCTR